MTDQIPQQPIGDPQSDWPIDWLRQTSPYINTQRGKTFVIWFSGEIVDSAEFTPLIHDLTLLSHLGIKLVVVHGMRPQIDAELTDRKISPHLGKSESPDEPPVSNRDQAPPMRATATEALPAVRSAVATVRCKLESAFSQGLPNSPMSGAQVALASGNFIVAKPYGVRDGIDYQHTGEVRKVRAQKIRALLDAEMVVMLSPIGYSPTGEMFNLLAEDVAMHTAIALDADKLIYLHQDASAINKDIREISASDPRQSTEFISADAGSAQQQSLRSIIDRSIQACRQGVNRSHIVDATHDDALLRELFTRDGSGLLIDSGAYDNIRSADTNSVSGIIQLIQPLIEDGTLVHRSKQDLEREIQNFYIIEREGSVICCASLNHYGEFAELGCLAVHPDFRASGKATDILEYLVAIARQNHCRTLFVLSTRSGDWFLEQGFKLDNKAILPDSKTIEATRGSKLYTFDLGS